MSGIFLLLVAVTKRGTRTTQQEQTVIEEQDTVKPHTIQQPPPAKVGSSAVIKPNVK